MPVPTVPAFMSIQEMRRKVLNRADTITVGECCAVTLEGGKKYASRDGREVNMVFQFEHMDVDSDGENKWTDKKMDLRKMKEVLTRWEKGLEGIAGTAFSGKITISPVPSAATQTTADIAFAPRKCWPPVFI